MATIAPYIRAKPNEAKLCLEVVEKLMREEDKNVRKAIAWALREISKKDPKTAHEFLQRYASSEDVNTRWIVREGSKKFQEKNLTIAKFNSQKMQLFYALYRRPLGERHDQGCKRKATSGTG
ncbi:MAG: DNA alkylation repair protein [Thermoplasmata archaeon]|nr:DNA alkylation repair protein [Thermoplasmata archaeon]